MTYRENAAPTHVGLAQLEQAVRENSSDHESRAQLALLQLQMGDLDAAQKNFHILLLQAVSGASISRADAFHNLAVIADLRGDRQRAITMAKNALDLDANHAGARTLLDALANAR